MTNRVKPSENRAHQSNPSKKLPGRLAKYSNDAYQVLNPWLPTISNIIVRVIIALLIKLLIDRNFDLSAIIKA